jgi:putative ABC transport system substrate-binding protein
MKRKTPLYLLVVILAIVHLAEAQQAKKIPRIGVLRPGSSPDPLIDAFRQGLRELGYVEGNNIQLEYRFGEGNLDRLPDLAAELVLLKPDIIVTSPAQPVLALKRLTTTIPIVMNTGDPVAQGLVASLAHPGGNITGLSYFLPEITSKAMELLRETVPSITRLAFLTDSTDPSYGLILKQLEPTARQLGVQLQLVEARQVQDIDNAFGMITKKRADGLQIMAQPVFTTQRARIVQFAANNRLPTTFTNRDYVEAGGLISYGHNAADLWRRHAVYVDKILKGAKPAELPIEQAMKFEIFVNLKTAKILGLTIPPTVLYRADKVIR